MIYPNGCAFCGHLERGHGQRYDGLHPYGRHGYQAPTNATRFRRMMANRRERAARGAK